MRLTDLSSNLYKNHESLLPAIWHTPLVKSQHLNLRQHIDHKHDICHDMTLRVRAEFSTTWPSSNKPMMCGDGYTSTDMNHTVTVTLGCADAGKLVTPFQILSICIAWKHEMEHVRQYTDTCIHPQSVNPRIVTELAATLNNPHFYRDNYGVLLFENKAFQAGFRDGPAMATAVLRAQHIVFTEQEIEYATMTAAERIRDSRFAASDNPFFTLPKFTDSQSILDALKKCESEIVRDPQFYTHSLLDDDDTQFSKDSTIDVIGQYLKSGRASNTFINIVLKENESGTDALKCLAAHNYLRTPTIALIMPTLTPDMLRMTEHNTYDPVSEISRTRPAFMAMRFRNSIIRASNSYVDGARQIDTDNLYLP